MKPKHHQVPIVEIKELFKHPNADALEIVHIEGYQCVVKKGSFKIGDCGVYIYPDSVVPEHPTFSFLWQPRTFEGEVPVKYRRITVRRFRGEYSEGLLLPLSNFPNLTAPVVGDDVSEILGVIHYDPPEPPQLGGDNVKWNRKQVTKWPKSLKGWFYFLLRKCGIDFHGATGGSNETGPLQEPPVYDVEAYKNYKGLFNPGEIVYVTEKIHGSNARYVYHDGHMYAGSRQLWKSESSKDIWRKYLEQEKWISDWCAANPGYVIYGEIVPTQGGNFAYGVPNGQTKLFIFDVLTPEGNWMKRAAYPPEIKEHSVPLFYHGPFEESEILKHLDGKSSVDNKTTKEGIVIRPEEERHIHGLGRLQLKIVSNKFLEVA